MKRIIPWERRGGFPEGHHGLSVDAVTTQRSRFGTNQIVEAPTHGWLVLARDTLKDPMLWFLLGTSALFWMIGDHTESLVLLAATLPLLAMDGYLHRRTQASTAAMSDRLASVATVIRGGCKQQIDAIELVPGDLVEVGPGEPFPADSYLLSTDAVQVDESALTGEALPVRKSPAPPPANATGDWAIDASAWAFAGTRMLSGKATARVVFTGGETLYGEIVRTALSGQHERTPLQIAVARLVATLIWVAAGFCLLLAAARLYQGHGLVDALISAVTLAVAALPEEFPVVLTFFLGLGVYRLARRKALVRRAIVVENIGRITVICSDKTGTLTEGKLQLAHRFPATTVTDRQLLTIAAMASRRESQDPLDEAILDEVVQDGVLEQPHCNVIARFPFTEDRKRETVVLQEDQTVRVMVKGAPETVLALCDTLPQECAGWMAKVDALAVDRHKVLACAWLDCPDGTVVPPEKEPDQGFRFAGLLAFEDPIREGVTEAIQQCRDAGIRIMMVTGDHPETARAIARDIGLGTPHPKVVTGETLMNALPAPDPEWLQAVDVIARALPSQKLALVRALQAAGEHVAVTGDGVNDVPALQAADVGIAMGERGTRAAREVAAIVLMDDNFRTIAGAIAEGRQLFSNLRQSFQYLLMVHIPLVITAALIPLAGYPILYLPIHIVWLELIIHPTAMLVFQGTPSEQAPAPHLPKDGNRLFDRRDTVVIVMTGMLITGLMFWSYERSLGAGLNVEHARSMALATLIIASAGVTTALRPVQTVASLAVISAALGSAVGIIQIPWLAELLHVQPLHLDDWVIAVLGAAACCLPLLWGRAHDNRRHRASHLKNPKRER